MSERIQHSQTEAFADIHVELPLHQRQLKTQLMARRSLKHSSQPWFAGTFMNYIKEYISTMQKKTRIASFAGLATMALVAAFTVMSLSTSTPVSAAQAQLRETKAVVQNLSPQESAALKQRINTNLSRHLDEGLKATDARIISSDEFQKTTGLNPDVKLPGMKISSYVAFTNTQREKVIIAVGSDDKPVVLFIDSGKGWTSPSQEQMQ